MRVRKAVTSLVAEPATADWVDDSRIVTPRKVASILEAKPTENFLAIGLDGQSRVAAYWDVSVGTLTNALVHPREVFGPAMRLGTVAAIVVAHNHPSGDPSPSKEDLAVTKRLVKCGRVLGIPLLDHVIVGNGKYESLRDAQYGLDFSN